MTLTTVLSSQHIAAIVDRVGVNEIMDQCIHRLTQALRDRRSDCSSMARSGFTYTHPHVGLLEWMPIRFPDGPATVKMVGYHPENPQREALPTIISSVLLFDTTTGHLRTVMDGTLLTAVRTGAASAVASRVLARHDSRHLGIVGCGAQAVTQVHAVTRLFPIERIHFYDNNAEVQSSFPSRVASLLDDSVQLCPSSLRELQQASDILCTATSVGVGQGPVITDCDLQPWVHINAVGADFPGKTEIPRALLERSIVCPDFPQQAGHEGECQQLSEEQVGPSLAEIVRAADDYEPARRQMTVFDSTGMAIEDHVTAELFCEYAKDLGFGISIPLEMIPTDPFDPYSFQDAKRATETPVK